MEAEQQCPFCGDNFSPGRLERHLAWHMQQISLFVPGPHNGEGEEDGNSDQACADEESQMLDRRSDLVFDSNPSDDEPGEETLESPETLGFVLTDLRDDGGPDDSGLETSSSPAVGDSLIEHSELISPISNQSECANLSPNIEQESSIRDPRYDLERTNKTGGLETSSSQLVDRFSRRKLRLLALGTSHRRLRLELLAYC